VPGPHCPHPPAPQHLCSIDGALLAGREIYPRLGCVRWQGWLRADADFDDGGSPIIGCTTQLLNSSGQATCQATYTAFLIAA
jgi:hypothetical protein